MKKAFQIISFLQKNRIVFILLIISSCSKQVKFNKVTTGVLVPKGQNIVYNNESIIEVNNNTIFIRKIEKYNQDLNLLEVDISKAESMLTYSRKELENDSALIDYYQISKDRKKTSIKNDFIFDNNVKYKIIYKVKDTVLCIKDKSILLLTRSH